MIEVDQKLPLELYEAPGDVEQVFVPVPYLERNNLKNSQIKVSDDVLGVKLSYPPPYEVVFKFELTDEQHELIEDNDVIPVDRENIEAVLS